MASYKALPLGMMFMFWTEYASLSATPPTLLVPFPLTSNGRGMHGLDPTTVHYLYFLRRRNISSEYNNVGSSRDGKDLNSNKTTSFIFKGSNWRV